MAIVLNAKDVSVEFPAKKVLSTVTLGVMEGDRIGIVGRNGDGKSTLLSVLAGAYTPDSGEVTYRGAVNIGVLGQSDALDDNASVGHAIVGDVPEYTWAADRKIREIIQELAGDIEWDALVGSLSGGQRRRVDLARLLIADWDVLMLDEPTNHLDMHAIAWLAEHLKTRWQKQAGALLVVTHDRWFLDEVALSMWEVHDGMVEAFEGGFSAYVLQRVERDRLIQLTEQKRQNLMRKELAWLSRGARARATKPKFHVKIAQDLIAGDPPLRDTLELKKAAITRLGKQVLDLQDIHVSYGSKPVLDGIDWLIGPGDRFGILGENGAGKSTLLNVMRGKLEPSSGLLKVGKTVKMAMLSQRLEELEAVANDRVREVLGRHKTRLMVDGKSVTTAQLLERLGFEREHMQSFVRDLSGGQKRRLQLLLVLADEPNVLILDEPGNDMDTDMLAVMEDLLDSWPGTLLIVSHDRYLMERVTDDQYALIDGKIRHMTGGVDEYLKLIAEKDASAAQSGKASQSGKPTNGSPAGKSETQARNEAAQNTSSNNTPSGNVGNNDASKLSGGELYQAKKQLASTERKLDTLNQAVDNLEQQMGQADPSDFVSLGSLQEQIQCTRAQIEELEDTWMELSEKIEG